MVVVVVEVVVVGQQSWADWVMNKILANRTGSKRRKLTKLLKIFLGENKYLFLSTKSFYIFQCREGVID